MASIVGIRVGSQERTKSRQVADENDVLFRRQYSMAVLASRKVRGGRCESVTGTGWRIQRSRISYTASQYASVRLARYRLTGVRISKFRTRSVGRARR